MIKLTLQQAKDRFIEFGECSHDRRFYKTFVPYKCDVEITDCGICGQRIAKVYLSC